jgi:hypothetical protein
LEVLTFGIEKDDGWYVSLNAGHLMFVKFGRVIKELLLGRGVARLAASICFLRVKCMSAGAI